MRFDARSLSCCCCRLVDHVILTTPLAVEGAEVKKVLCYRKYFPRSLLWLVVVVCVLSGEACVCCYVTTGGIVWCADRGSAALRLV
jgi:hypothetical protein